MYHKIRIRSPIEWPSAGEPISSNSISTSNREQRRSNVVPCILPNLVDRRQSRRSFCIRFTDENAWYDIYIYIYLLNVAALMRQCKISPDFVFPQLQNILHDKHFEHLHAWCVAKESFTISEHLGRPISLPHSQSKFWSEIPHSIVRYWLRVISFFSRCTTPSLLAQKTFHIGVNNHFHWYRQFGLLYSAFAFVLVHEAITTIRALCSRPSCTIPTIAIYKSMHDCSCCCVFARIFSILNVIIIIIDKTLSYLIGLVWGKQQAKIFRS